MSIDNLRSIGIVSWFALRDDDYETNMMARFSGILRADAAFCKDFDVQFDRLLVDYGVCTRKPDGYLSGLLPGVDAVELEDRIFQISEILSMIGYVDRAVEVLRKAGYDASKNSIGHIAISLSPDKPE